jgi:uncharacterized membrane protein
MLRSVQNWLVEYKNSFSFVGLLFATLFFAVSVTPSLLPRIYFVQGVLSAFALAIGYGVGLGLLGIYRFLELPEPRERVRHILKWVAVGVVAIVFVAFVWRMTYWQNSIRELMQMPPLETAYPYRVAAIALVLGALLVSAARLFRTCGNYVATKLERFVPRRIALATGYTLVIVFILFVTNDVIAAQLLAAADSFFLRMDKLVDDRTQQPADPWRTGSEASLVSWDAIGKQGKDFLTTGPSLEDIKEFRPDATLQPIRVYVGMRSRETPAERAELALEELKRVGGFDRSVLVVATPTGTGWLDPSAVDTVEYLHGGDTAIVSIQYSYLPSWITILVDPRRSIESAIALFDVIYPYWKSLPKSSRPKLYLHGLSLGSLGSERSADLLTIFEDPFQGAVWSGPPFPSQQWQQIVEHRNADSPAWLPTFRDSRIVRFTAQQNALATGQPWSELRVVYIQYASDPMVWFSPDLAWSRPDWLVGQRGPDVSPYLDWYPIVTFLQAGFDVPMATSVPIGHGHNYSPSSYIDAWIAVTRPAGWTPEEVAQLKTHFQSRDTPKP